MKARLVILEGTRLGETIRLTEGRQMIGRAEPATLIIPDPSVSKQHAEMELRGTKLYVKDLDSKNGIYYGRNRVTEALIDDQELFAVGSVYLRFENGAELPDIIGEFREQVTRVTDELSRRIIGQTEVIEQLLACLFSGGHALLVGVPGLAKTYLVRSLADVLELSFKRVQFTPDLMPSDISGTNIISMDEEGGGRTLKFMKGPVFTQLLLADEINRTPPKTQAALLEAMQERQVTISNESYSLPAPFMVIATQNPIEQEGTYPLPEAQLDRFMFNIHVGYPEFSEEEEILRRTCNREEIPIKKLLDGKAVLRYIRAVQQVEVSPYVISYVTRLVRSTRPKDDDALPQSRETLEWGAGPRAGQFLIWGGKAFAAMDGRLSVSCEDIRRCAVPVLRHRLSPNFQSQASGLSTVDIVTALVKNTQEPEMAKYL